MYVPTVLTMFVSLIDYNQSSSQPMTEGALEGLCKGYAVCWGPFKLSHCVGHQGSAAQLLLVQMIRICGIYSKPIMYYFRLTIYDTYDMEVKSITW